MNDRQSCRFCGESVLKTARLCPHCQQTVLVRLVLTRSVDDERAAYRAARAIAELGISSVTFLDLKRRLDAAPGELLGSLTAAESEAVGGRLEAVGIQSYEIQAFEGSTARPPGGPGWAASRRLRWVWLSLVVVAVAAVWLISANRNPEDVEPPVPSAEQVAERAIASTVRLRCNDRVGAGFFVGPELLLTNAHVVGKSRHVDVTFESGLVAKGRVVERDEWYDYSVIEVRGVEVQPLAVADATTLQRGDPVYFAGSPKGLDFTFSRGIISHPERMIQGVGYLQVDAAVNPGNSGGPLLDEHGDVVGLMTMVVGEGSNLGLVLPINYLSQARKLRHEELFEALDNDAWQAFVERAEEQNRQAVEDFRAQQGTIELVDVQYGDDGTFRAVVGQWNDTRPESVKLRFALVDGDRVLCRPSGTVSRWSRGASRTELRKQDPRFALWLERNHLLQTMYLGQTPLSMSGCPDPLTVIRAELILKTTRGPETGDER
jgi:hypothetical protein